jgi:hypothetical protein
MSQIEAYPASLCVKITQTGERQGTRPLVCQQHRCSNLLKDHVLFRLSGMMSTPGTEFASDSAVIPIVEIPFSESGHVRGAIYHCAVLIDSSCVRESVS